MQRRAAQRGAKIGGSGSGTFHPARGEGRGSPKKKERHQSLLMPAEMEFGLPPQALRMRDNWQDGNSESKAKCCLVFLVWSFCVQANGKQGRCALRATEQKALNFPQPVSFWNAKLEARSKLNFDFRQFGLGQQAMPRVWSIRGSHQTWRKPWRRPDLDVVRQL